MAYAAVTSLMHTISRFSKSGDIQIVENSSPEMIKLVEEETSSLANVLQSLDTNSRRFSSKRLHALDEQIRDAVFKLEDVLESHLLHHFLSQSQNNIHQHSFLFSVDIEELKPDIDSLIQTVNKIKADYIYELSTNNLPREEQEEEDDDDVIVKTEPVMFGILSNRLLTEIKREMVDSTTGFSGVSHISALWGMAGIGKTTIARKLFQDPFFSTGYMSRAWVTVGPEYQMEDVLLDIIKQLDPDNFDDGKKAMPPEASLQLKKSHFRWWFKNFLKYTNCLIVLDDVWDIRIPKFLFKHSRGCRGTHICNILITTRLGNLSESMRYKNIPFLDKKGSWDLLCAKVFGEDESLCPSELKIAGKKIAENCEGLPLTIVKVANILSKLERTPELWNKVAASKQHPVYVDAYAEMHKVLLPSYYALPQHLRISFLYMAVFLQNYEIPCAKLLMLWAAEGFIRLEYLVDRDRYWRLSMGLAEGKYSVYKDHFEKLLMNSVLTVHSTASIVTYKTVSLHSSFWYMCKKEASKSKFFHSFTTLDDCLPQGIDSQRRLCIYNPVLFAIKDAFNIMASVSAARSLLCTGMYHPYPVPVCFGLRLLRVLEALPTHFYEFPVEVLKLIHLTYFALTCDGDLPASISKLWNLVYLIVNRRLSIKSSAGAPSYLPVEIWDMKNLEHLQVMGRDLPEPPEGSHVKLLKLSKLLNVSPHSCAKRILERFPNLTKLGIRIELSPDDAVHQPLGCFDHIRDMRYLSSFKCVVVNPRMMFEVAAPPAVPLPIFPESLLKLTLNGLGYPWEEMSKISSLPNLRVLKLLSYAFRGPKWDVQGKEFPYLEVLVIDETDLVQWTIKDDYQFKCLSLLSIKHCYNLEEMPTFFSDCSRTKIEVVDCNPLAVNCANLLKENSDRYDFPDWIDLNVHSSWDDKKLLEDINLLSIRG